jgi:hypothetical protein
MPEALDILDNFVSNLDVTSKKRKATEDLNGVGPNTGLYENSSKWDCRNSGIDIKEWDRTDNSGIEKGKVG